MRTGIRRIGSTGWQLAALAAVITVGCDKVQLTAPVSSSVTLTTPTQMLPTGGSTQLSAQVIEPAGTPVQNGTTVRFTTNLGRVDPVETQTRNGVATTTFYAGDVAGSAEVKATSGASPGATSATSGTSTTTAANTVTILIGAAAVDAVSLRASAGTVPALGGTVEITATVTSAGGATLSGIPVSFSTTAGTLSTPREVSDGNGEAKTRLTTDTTAEVTATAGTKTSDPVKITAQNPIATPTISLGEPKVGTATKDAQLYTFTATLSFVDAYGSPVKFIWDFGDGVVVENQSASITHAYKQASTVFHVSVTAVYASGLKITASTDIQTSGFR
jgi:adhesin/invasin